MHYALSLERAFRTGALDTERDPRIPSITAGTGHAGLYSGLDQRTGMLLRSGRRTAASTGSPSPANQRIFADIG